MFKTDNYNLLMTHIIGSIPYDINYESLKKLNISTNTLKKKETRKLNLKEIDNLNKFIKKITSNKMDQQFNETILRNLKLFLIYGIIIVVDRKSIKLELQNANITTNLTISINENSINMQLSNKEYDEKAMLKEKENFYYTKYSKTKKEKKKYQTYTEYDIKKEESLHIFNDNKETFKKEETEYKSYKEDKKTKKRIYTFGVNSNYKDIEYSYRTDEGYIIKKFYTNYFLESLRKNNSKNYAITEDYNCNDKYMNTSGYYRLLDENTYVNHLREKTPVKKLFKVAKTPHYTEVLY